jgi:Ca2+-binding RTX toxin-like protein
MATSRSNQRWPKQTPGKTVGRAKQARRDNFAPVVEALDRRVMLAVTASFAQGTLRVTGDEQDNVITVSRDAGGTILVNNGAVPIAGGVATIANTTHFHIVGAGGDDNISLNEANGALPGAAIFGGTGNDTLTGGSGIDFIDGETGSDTALMGAGDDTFAWNSGDGSDVVDGQAGVDSVVFNGSNLAEKFGISDSGSGSGFHRIRLTRDVGNVAMDLGTIEDIDLNAQGGTDTVTIDDQTATDLFTVNLDLQGTAGGGDDQADAVILNGTNGSDGIQIASFGLRVAIGGLFPFVNITGEDGLDALTVNTLDGNDVVDASDLAATNASELIKLTVNGGAGNDTLTGSQGADTFVWVPGDGSDVIDGGDDPDTLVFNGSDLSEKFDFSANGNRVRLTRDVGGVTMDLGGIETLTVNALGGADTATVNDLTGNGVVQINLNLAGAVGGNTGDGIADSVTVNGRNAADLIPILGDIGVILVNGGFANGGGLPYFLVMRAVEPSDSLRINGNGGDDTIDASALQTPVAFVADGGAGNDGLVGSHGGDLVLGGPGNDLAFLGDGDDTFVWNAGDGSDTVEGMAGTNTLNFNGSNIDEDITVWANGPQVRVTDDVGNVVIDLDGIEQLAVSAMGGTDDVVVNDLGGTALAHVKVRNIGDGQPDDLTVNGSSNTDTIAVEGDFPNGVTVLGLAAVVEFLGAIGVSDGLTVNGLGGADTIDASALEAGAVTLALNGGGGADVLTGSQGEDFINGGAQMDTINVVGTATVLGGDGDDAVNVNTDGAGAARVVFDATQQIGALTIGGGGVASLTAGGAKVLTATSLNITGSGKLDLNDNALIVDYSLASPIGTIQALLKTGFNGGAWNGNGIMTSLGNTSTFALGFGEASDVTTGGIFAGQTVDGTSVVVRFTRYGDATLDGRVDFNDLVRLAQNFNSGVPATNLGSWRRGDFTYDGMVNFDDLVKLAQNYNTGVPGAAVPSAPEQSAAVGVRPGRRVRPLSR